MSCPAGTINELHRCARGSTSDPLTDCWAHRKAEAQRRVRQFEGRTFFSYYQTSDEQRKRLIEEGSY